MKYLLNRRQHSFNYDLHGFMVAVADTDDTGIYAIFAILVLANFYSYGQEIPSTASAFLAGGKNLLDVHGFSFEDVESFVAALYHGYCGTKF